MHAAILRKDAVGGLPHGDEPVVVALANATIRQRRTGFDNQ